MKTGGGKRSDARPPRLPGEQADVRPGGGKAGGRNLRARRGPQQHVLPCLPGADGEPGHQQLRPASRADGNFNRSGKHYGMHQFQQAFDRSAEAEGVALTGQRGTAKLHAGSAFAKAALPVRLTNYAEGRNPPAVYFRQNSEVPFSGTSTLA